MTFGDIKILIALGESRILTGIQNRSKYNL